MNNECEGCGKKLKSADKIVQMAEGRYLTGQITPTYGDFVGDPDVREWHEACFAEYELIEQTGPYECLNCGQQITHGSKVFYIVTGTKPAPGYVRPERRGYTMPWIIHARNCEKD